MQRREFLKLALGGLHALALPCALQGCRPTETVGEQMLARGEQARVWAWLRMFATKGKAAIPTSEADYMANRGSIQVAMPLNGGTLQADGSWQQEHAKTTSDWARRLPKLAREAEQLYMPGVGNDRQGVLAVLEAPSRQRAAAEALVELATEGRYDSPWDGVYLDLEGIPIRYSRSLNSFLSLLSEACRRAGLLVGISIPARVSDSGDDPEDTYTYDIPTVAEAADFVDLRCYDYWTPSPRSIAPYWWIEGSIAAALAGGIPAGRMTVGMGNFSRYWPQTGAGPSSSITYEHAMALVAEAGADLEWREDNQHGLVRERYAKVGDGHLWIHDWKTHEYGLQLADRYGVLGTTLFAPGMGDSRHWHVLEAWQSSSQNLSGRRISGEQL